LKENEHIFCPKKMFGAKMDSGGKHDLILGRK